MASTTLRLLRGVSLYSLAIFLPRLLRVVTVPLVVHAVSIEVYGVFVILMMIVPFAQIVADCGTGTAALRLAAEEPEGGRRALFASLLSTRLVFALVVVVGLMLAARPLTQSLTNGAAGHSIFVLVVANIVPTAILGALADQLRSDERFTTLSLLSLGRALAEGALTVFWVVMHPGGLRGLLLATLCARLLVLGPFLFSCRTTLRARPTLDRVWRLLRLGAPFGALYLLTGLRDVGQYLIKLVLGIADVARYDLALRIVGPVALANAALTMALEPHVYRTYGAPGGRAMISLFLGCYVVFFATVAFGVSALAPEIFPLLAPDSYRGAAIIAPALIFTFVADGVLRIAGLGADLAKRTAVWAIVAVMHLAIALPLTWVLLPRAGLFGAAIAILVATLATTAVCRALVQRIFPLQLPVARALVVIVIGAVGATVLVATARGGAGSLAIRAATTLLFFVMAWRVFGLDVSVLRSVLRGEHPS